MPNQRVKYIIIFVLLLGAVVRFWGLGSAELTFDEGLDAFRSIGYLDYLNSPTQTTPVQWFNQTNLPWWTNLSFHDHPFLFFFIQHIFLGIGENSLLVARLPSVVAGIFSIFIFYLIACRIFSKFEFTPKPRFKLLAGIPANKIAGLMSAVLAATSMALVLNSRLAMQESVLFLFILMNLYFFIRLLDNYKYWFAFGLTLGLVFLTKYTGFFLIPSYLVFLLITKHPLLRNKRLYWAFLTSVILFLPVITYNFYLYKNFGHFDLQFFYLFRQSSPQWQPLNWGGKSQEPFSNLTQNLRIIFSIPFLVIAFVGFVLSCGWHKFSPNLDKRVRDSLILLLSLVFFITILLVYIGSAIRFSSFYSIPAIFLVTFVLLVTYDRYPKKHLILILFMIFATHELWFTVDHLFINAPDYGVIKLDKYFDSIIRNGRAELIPKDSNPNLNKVIESYALPRPVKLDSVGIIYDDNIDTSPELWLFARRRYYHGIPTIKISGFEQALTQNDLKQFKDFTLYLVLAGPAAPQEILGHISYSEKLEIFLKQITKKNPPLIIRGDNNIIAFTIYKFSVQ